MKKAEMGIGTLILFITFIVIAAVAVIVLVGTTAQLQSKALKTGKGAAEEVSSQMKNVEIYATDGSSGNNVDYFYNNVKLASGSEPLKFTNNYILFTMSLSNVSLDYTFDGDDTTGASNINCSLNPVSDGTAASLSNTTNDGYFGIEYSLEGPHFTQGYLSDGDIVKICFKSPRSVGNMEEMRFTFLPKTGQPARIKLTMPSIISENRIYIFP